MGALGRSLLVALSVSAVIAGSLASSATAQVTTFKGVFGCSDRGYATPLEEMNVELWKRGDHFWPVEWVGRQIDRGYTASDGSFSLRSGREEDNYFVRMALRDNHGVHLKDFWGINDWSVDTGERRNDRGTRDYGTMVFAKRGKSHKCAVWSSVHHAYREFREITGGPLPTHGVEIRADAPNFGVPYTPGTTMMWAGDFPVGYNDPPDDSTARHEFAHVIRHSLDGNFGHFLGDAANFNYAQNHRACNHTNSGFAFNEGWAEFWAGRFWPAPDCGRPGDYQTEGNVAAALTELMENCAGGQKKIMVETLRNNPMRIHSYAEFRAALGCPIPKYTPVTVVAATAESPPPAEEPPAVRATIPRDQVRAESKLIRRLRGHLKVSLRKAQSAPACLKAPCTKALKELTLPAVLRYRIQVAKIQRGAAARFDSKKELNKQSKLPIGKLLKVQGKRERKERRKLLRVSLAGVKGAMKAARPVFRVDSSRLTRRLHKDLTKALAMFRKAKKKSARTLPGPLTLLPATHELPKPHKRSLPTPAPVPLPGPTLAPLAPQPVASQLTIEQCEPQVAVGKPIPVSGKLLPAVQGTPITVVYSHPNAGSVQVPTQTDAAGNWAASYEPSANYPGTWSIVAAFAGDAGRKPATSAACQTSYAQGP